jgi:hypothetical protein
MPSSGDDRMSDPLATLRSWSRRLAIAGALIFLFAGLLTDRSFLVPGLVFLAMGLADIWWHSPIRSPDNPSEPPMNLEIASGDLPGGQLEVHRRIGTAMMRRPFEIVIDGEPIQELTRGQSAIFPLAAGQHVVQARLGAYTSSRCTVQIRPNSMSRIDVWGSIFSMRRAMQEPSRTIDIARVPLTDAIT